MVEVRLPEQLDGLDGLVIPGGESTTIMKLAAQYGLDEAIRSFGRPIFGTCAGMIVLAQILPGHEWLILAGGVVVAALGVLVVFYAYNSGRLDPYLPDALDKKRKVE